MPDVSTGDRTRGLLSYLFGPGRRDEHTDPHIVAAFALPGLTDPGRVPLAEHQAALSELAAYLDQPVRLREQRLGKKVPQHVWHCPVRTAPGDRYLTDEEWAEVARRIVHATGIAPHGDDSACRWIAVRHADDHIHILATSVREDGRRPANRRDGQRAQAECRRIEEELGLRRLNPGDGTAPKTPTSAEQSKAQRHGRQTTARQWLREHAYTAAAAARDEDEYFAILTALGIQVRPRLGPQTGETTGYSLAAPDDTNRDGEPVWYGGSSLAPDLSLTRLRERFNTPTAATSARANVYQGRGSSWRRAEQELRTAPVFTLGTPGTEDADDAVVQAQAAALGELLHNAAVTAPRAGRAELRTAAAAFDRANRSLVRAHHHNAAALRRTGKELARTLADPDGGTVAALLCTAILALQLLDHWYQDRNLRQQATATRQALAHLQAAYQHTAHPVLAQLTARTPGPEEQARLAAVVRATVPDHAGRILADHACPALLTVLAQAESAGTPARRALTDAARQRELDTADHPAEVLLWRLRNATADRIDQRARTARARTSSSIGVKPVPPTVAGAPTGTRATSDPTRRR